MALTLVRPGTHGTGGGGENNRNHDEGSDYRHGYDFSQSERLTWKSGGGVINHAAFIQGQCKSVTSISK